MAEVRDLKASEARQGESPVIERRGEMLNRTKMSLYCGQGLVFSPPRECEYW